MKGLDIIKVDKSDQDRLSKDVSIENMFTHFKYIEAEKDKVCEVYCPRTDDLYTQLNGTKLSYRTSCQMAVVIGHLIQLLCFFYIRYHLVICRKL